jgi:segregation and condensation protein B
MTEPASQPMETANDRVESVAEPTQALADGVEAADEIEVAPELEPADEIQEEPASEPLDATAAAEEGAEGDDEAPVTLGSAALKRVLESLIFVADKPVSAKQLAEIARSSLAEVRPLLEELVAEYEQRGVQLCVVAGGYQFRSSSASAEFVQAFVAPKPVRLSRAQLETLAIVAYRQPITRPEVDEVRGVDSGSSLRMLAERRLVKILGRKDEPGRPLLYGTTPSFLEFFGLASLKDLPTLKEFSELTEEHKALFESKIGESFDLAAANFAASEVQHEAEEALLAEEQAAADEQDQAEAEADERAREERDEDDGQGESESEEPAAVSAESAGQSDDDLGDPDQHDDSDDDDSDDDDSDDDDSDDDDSDDDDSDDDDSDDDDDDDDDEED